MVNFLYLSMTSSFQAFFILVRLIPFTFFTVFPCRTLFDSVYSQSVSEFTTKLSGSFSSLLLWERNVLFVTFFMLD